MSTGDTPEDNTLEQVNQALRKIELLTDTFLEHLTNLDNRIESTVQKLEDTMNARIESRVQEELGKRGYAPTADESLGSD